jgi:GNAT superfamily N-acetyltransferase
VSSPRRISVRVAEPADAAAIAELRTAVSADLTERYGHGHWSGCATERGVRLAIRTSRVLVAHRGATLLGTLRLATKKPWAIDVRYFTPVPRALYLLDMAVAPRRQRSGIGRRLLEEALEVARRWPAQAIRLDAYDAPAGAGTFYARCGYRECGRVIYRTVPLVYFERVFDAGAAPARTERRARRAGHRSR